MPDRVLYNALVYTQWDDQPWAEAVAIRGDRILAVGRTADILALASPRTARHDLGGALVLPGFTDAHIHFHDLARRRGEVDLAGAADLKEVQARIAAHRAERPAHWRTLEVPCRVAAAIAQALAERPADVLVLDCLTLLTSNLLVQEPVPATEAEAAALVLAEVDALLACWQTYGGHWIVISNEVGMGLVPPYPLGRRFRDVLGRANQRLAAAADETLFLVAGKPIRLG
jgi:adenosylcobinamide kinase/adenosylcobinamide-phosphate guanylyltransferase